MRCASGLAPKSCDGLEICLKKQLPETSEASQKQEMLKRLKQTHRHNLQQLARKQEMLERFKRHRRNVQKLARKQKMLKRLRKTHWRDLNKLARKQEMLKRLKKTHWRNLHKLARKQRNAVKTYRGTGMASAESSEARQEAGIVEKTKQETPTESSQG